MPLVANPLFDDGELEHALGYAVNSDRVGTVERLVWGRFKPILKLTERPADLDETIWSLAIGLGGYFYENPTAMTSTTMSGDKAEFPDGREGELLAALSDYVSSTPSGVPAPRGRFPRPQPYPDPVRTASCYYRCW